MHCKHHNEADVQAGLVETADVQKDYLKDKKDNYTYLRPGKV